MQQITIHVTVNDEAYTRTAPVNMTLLQFLREELHLTGTKEGCDEGECGACTVLVDGHPMNSCLVLAAELDGRRVLTVEGLAQDGRLHPLQEAFLEVGAVQCGYCTPGMLLSGIALLDLYPHPTREQIRKEMEGNICRCTGRCCPPSPSSWRRSASTEGSERRGGRRHSIFLQGRPQLRGIHPAVPHRGGRHRPAAGGCADDDGLRRRDAAGGHLRRRDSRSSGHRLGHRPDGAGTAQRTLCRRGPGVSPSF